MKRYYPWIFNAIGYPKFNILYKQYFLIKIGRYLDHRRAPYIQVHNSDNDPCLSRIFSPDNLWDMEFCSLVHKNRHNNLSISALKKFVILYMKLNRISFLKKDHPPPTPATNENNKVNVFFKNSSLILLGIVQTHWVYNKYDQRR